MRSVLRTVALAVSAWLALVPAARADVHVSLRNGRVTIIAKDATLRQILAEWARVGHTKMVNAERIPGGPLTLELKDVPEAEALDILLRSLNGYFAAPRTALAGADASVYESVVVMPTIASAAARNPAPSAAPAPFAQAPVFSPNQNEEEPQDNANVRPVGNPAQPNAQQPRPPIFSTFPMPQQNNNGGAAVRPMLPSVRPGVVAPAPQGNPGGDAPAPQPVASPAPAPSQPAGGPVGVSTPGMVAPAPQQPGTAVRPQQ